MDTWEAAAECVLFRQGQRFWLEQAWQERKKKGAWKRVISRYRWAEEVASIITGEVVKQAGLALANRGQEGLIEWDDQSFATAHGAALHLIGECLSVPMMAAAGLLHHVHWYDPAGKTSAMLDTCPEQLRGKLFRTIKEHPLTEPIPESIENKLLGRLQLEGSLLSQGAIPEPSIPPEFRSDPISLREAGVRFGWAENLMDSGRKAAGKAVKRQLSKIPHEKLGNKYVFDKRKFVR